MTWIDIVVLVLAVAIVGLFFGVRFYRKKTGKYKGCGGCSDCSACSSCNRCTSKKEEKE